MSKKRQPGTFLHVFGHTTYFRYQVTVLPGTVCSSGVSWPTAEEAAVHCQTLKIYLFREYRLKLDESIGEEWSTLAHRLNVPLSGQQDTFASFPEAVQEFLTEHRSRLEAYRDSLPEVEMWERVHYDPALRCLPDFLDWSNRVYRADADERAFRTLACDHFQGLLRGAAASSASICNSLSQAERMVSCKGNDKLDRRSEKLLSRIEQARALQWKLAEDLREFEKENAEVLCLKDELVKNRPTLA